MLGIVLALLASSLAHGLLQSSSVSTKSLQMLGIGRRNVFRRNTDCNGKEGTTRTIKVNCCRNDWTNFKGDKQCLDSRGSGSIGWRGSSRLYMGLSPDTKGRNINRMFGKGRLLAAAYLQMIEMFIKTATKKLMDSKRSLVIAIVVSFVLLFIYLFFLFITLWLHEN